MAGNAVFTCGRKRYKTYEEVANTDEQFCREVLEAKVPNEFYPAEFKNYLRSLEKYSIIAERGPFDFVAGWNDNILAEFKNIIGELEMTTKKVHEPTVVKTNAFLDLYYQYFIKKFIFNLKNEPAYSRVKNDYVTIFPFKVEANTSKSDAEEKYAEYQKLLRSFDTKFKDDMQQFLNQYFNGLEFQNVSKNFLANIYRYRRTHIADNTLREILNVKDYVNDPKAKISDSFFNQRKLERCVYLKNFPRLNSDGVLRYRSLYFLYDNFMRSMKCDPVDIPKHYIRYFAKLPEINCYELCSLLDLNFFRSNRKKYDELFQKYLFFFIHALNSEEKPIFFIDDILFHCLKGCERYEKSRDDVLQLRVELSMLAMVHLRKKRANIDLCKSNYEPPETVLKNIKTYIENFPEIRTATVEDYVSNLLEFNSLFSTNDTIFHMAYLPRSLDDYKKRNSLYVDVLKGALYDREIKRLISYNPLTGEETSIVMPLMVKDKIREFIQKYNHCDISQKLPSGKFLTWGLEHFFYENTIDYEEKASSHLSQTLEKTTL